MRLIFIDTETTGLPFDMESKRPQDWPYLVAVAWQSVSWNEEQNTFASGEVKDFIVKPWPLPGANSHPDALKLHGITKAMQHSEGRPRLEVCGELLLAMYQADVIICHNVQFDMGVLRAEFTRLNCGFPPVAWFCTKEGIGDVLGQPAPDKQRKYRPNVEYRLPTLDELHQHLFGEPIEGRETHHGARIDMLAVKRCFIKLAQMSVIAPETLNVTFNSKS